MHGLDGQLAHSGSRQNNEPLLDAGWFLPKDIQMVFAHWALAALHGHLFMAIAQTTLDLAGIFYQQGVLHMLHMDGQEHSKNIF